MVPPRPGVEHGTAPGGTEELLQMGEVEGRAPFVHRNGPRAGGTPEGALHDAMPQQ